MTAEEFRKEFPNGIPGKPAGKRKSGARLETLAKKDPLIKPEPEKSSKYGNNQKEVNGIIFDSEKEGDRYAELLILERLGEIENLILQPSYVLAKGVLFEGETVAKRPLKYFADFTYYCKKRDKQIIEDVKSKITAKNPTYRIKKHLMKAILGLDITEF